MALGTKPLEVGDLIVCQCAEHLLETHEILEKMGFQTDFVYNHDGKDGYWLEIKGKE